MINFGGGEGLLLRLLLIILKKEIHVLLIDLVVVDKVFINRLLQNVGECERRFLRKFGIILFLVEDFLQTGERGHCVSIK